MELTGVPAVANSSPAASAGVPVDVAGVPAVADSLPADMAGTPATPSVTPAAPAGVPANADSPRHTAKNLSEKPYLMIDSHSRADELPKRLEIYSVRKSLKATDLIA